MIILIYMLGFMGSNIFYTVSSIFGYEYAGIADTSIYVVYSIIVMGLNISILINYLVVKQRKVSRRDLAILSLPLFIIFFYLLEIMINGRSNLVSNWFYYYLLWSMPAMYSGYLLVKENKTNDFIRWLEGLAIIISLNSIKVIIILFYQGFRLNGIGGATYQTASYIAAFAYGTLLYFIFSAVRSIFDKAI